jgi:hypothetical protein
MNDKYTHRIPEVRRELADLKARLAAEKTRVKTLGFKSKVYYRRELRALAAAGRFKSILYAAIASERADLGEALYPQTKLREEIRWCEQDIDTMEGRGHLWHLGHRVRQA